ncbi:hypothetical protein [Paenibacillus puerhi]|uniref:hypothetical protein n=1 Tax=Paenibacillus puerhi TaxID=2692622 RepID=UPI0013577FD3|nr:hypothetical protein [Paenibacillus puerhi]
MSAFKKTVYSLLLCLVFAALFIGINKAEATVSIDQQEFLFTVDPGQTVKITALSAQSNGTYILLNVTGGNYEYEMNQAYSSTHKQVGAQSAYEDNMVCQTCYSPKWHKSIVNDLWYRHAFERSGSYLIIRNKDKIPLELKTPIGESKYLSVSKNYHLPTTDNSFKKEKTVTVSSSSNSEILKKITLNPGETLKIVDGGSYSSAQYAGMLEIAMYSVWDNEQQVYVYKDDGFNNEGGFGTYDGVSSTIYATNASRYDSAEILLPNHNLLTYAISDEPAFRKVAVSPGSTYAVEIAENQRRGQDFYLFGDKYDLTVYEKVNGEIRNQYWGYYVSPDESYNSWLLPQGRGGLYYDGFHITNKSSSYLNIWTPYQLFSKQYFISQPVYTYVELQKGESILFDHFLDWYGWMVRWQGDVFSYISDQLNYDGTLSTYAYYKTNWIGSYESLVNLTNESEVPFRLSFPSLIPYKLSLESVFDYIKVNPKQTLALFNDTQQSLLDLSYSSKDPYSFDLVNGVNENQHTLMFEDLENDEEYFGRTYIQGLACLYNKGDNSLTVIVPRGKMLAEVTNSGECLKEEVKIKKQGVFDGAVDTASGEITYPINLLALQGALPFSFGIINSLLLK